MTTDTTRKTVQVTVNRIIVTTDVVDMHIICPKCGMDTRVNDGVNGRGVYFDTYEEIVEYNITTKDNGDDLNTFDTDYADREYLGADLCTDYRCGNCGESLIVTEEQPQ